jgi:hypothetical protein
MSTRPSLMHRDWFNSVSLKGYPGMSAFVEFYIVFQVQTTHCRSRVCIKIPTTPESILACQRLERQGISTLATILFTVPQALAATQAGCQYVAPYFNGKQRNFQAFPPDNERPERATGSLCTGYMAILHGHAARASCSPGHSRNHQKFQGYWFKNISYAG